MRFIWAIFLVVSVLGMWGRLLGIDSQSFAKLTCGITKSCATPSKTEQKAEAVANDIYNNSIKCHAGEGKSCLAASVALDGIDKTEEAIQLAARACEMRAEGACFIFGRSLLKARRLHDAIPAFMAGCVQEQAESCVALGDIGSQLNDVRSVLYGYQEACYRHSSLVGCRHLSRLLTRQGKTSEAVDAALKPCGGRLTDECIPLLVPGQDNLNQASNLRIQYLTRIQQALKQLMAEDNNTRKAVLAAKSVPERRKALQTFAQRSMPRVQQLAAEIRQISAVPAPLQDTALFAPIASAFNDVLNLYERGLRFEILFLTSGDQSHWRQARETYAAVARSYLRFTMQSQENETQSETHSRVPASAIRPTGGSI